MQLIQEAGFEIRAKRKEMGLSLEELAYLTGYSVPTLRKIEQGCDGTLMKTISDVASELGIVIEVRRVAS